MPNGNGTARAGQLYYAFLGTLRKPIRWITYNESSGTCAGMWVIPWAPIFVPSSRSQYLIHDNHFIGTAQYADAMYVYDDPNNRWIQAEVWNNTLDVQDILSEGFGIYNTKGTVAWGNSITGSLGFDGIGMWGSIQSTTIGNNVSGFTPDPISGLAQIYLDPMTSHDLVVCADPTTVLNQGTNNVVIGCAAAGDSQILSHTPATPIARPKFSNKKPLLP